MTLGSNATVLELEMLLGDYDVCQTHLYIIQCFSRISSFKLFGFGHPGDESLLCDALEYHPSIRHIDITIEPFRYDALIYAIQTMPMITRVAFNTN